MPAQLKKIDYESALGLISNEISSRETEHNWESKESALLRLNALCSEGMPFELIIGFLKNHANLESIFRLVSSLRTQLAISACCTLSGIITCLGTYYEPFGDVTLSNLLKACSQTKKIVSNSATTTIKTLISNAPSFRYLNAISNSLLEKNASFRIRVAEFFKELFVRLDFKGLNKQSHQEQIDTTLRRILGDASVEVRTLAKEILEMYQLLWPDKIGSFMDSLDYSTKKQLQKIEEKSSFHSGRPNNHGHASQTLLNIDVPDSMFSPQAATKNIGPNYEAEFRSDQLSIAQNPTMFQRALEFLKSKEIQLKIFDQFGLNELEDASLEAENSFEISECIQTGKPKANEEIFALLKCIIKRSKRHNLWTKEDFVTTIERLIFYLERYPEKSHVLYALFVLLFNQGFSYSVHVPTTTWDQLVRILATDTDYVIELEQEDRHRCVKYDLVELIVDELLDLLGKQLPLNTISCIFLNICYQSYDPSKSPCNFEVRSGFSSLLSASTTTSKFLQTHFELLYYGIVANSENVEILKQESQFIKEALYECFQHSRVKFLANKVFFELYKGLGSNTLFEIFSELTKPQKKLIKISADKDVFDGAASSSPTSKIAK